MCGPKPKGVCTKYWADPPPYTAGLVTLGAEFVERCQGTLPIVGRLPGSKRKLAVAEEIEDVLPDGRVNRG